MLEANKTPYPFGSIMPTRVWSDASRAYRFGFNTQEKDNEVAGNGNSYTAEFWQYDGRLGRRFNIDYANYSFLSTFSCFNNNPLYFIDPNGNKFDPASQKIVNDFKKDLKSRIDQLSDLRKTNKKLGYDNTQVDAAIKELQQQQKEIALLEASPVEISLTSSSTSKGGTTMVSDNKLEVTYSTLGNLSHELRHCYQFISGEIDFIYHKDLKKYTMGFLYDLQDEVSAYKVQEAFNFFEPLSQLFKGNITSISSKNVLPLDPNYKLARVYTYNDVEFNCNINTHITKSILKQMYPGGKVPKEVKKLYKEYKNKPFWEFIDALNKMDVQRNEIYLKPLP